MRADANSGADVIGSAPRSPVRLRHARRADIDAIAAIERASFGDPWDRGAFENLLEDPRASFLIAEHAGTVRGYVVAWFVLDEGEIGNLAVSESARRQGVGSLLLDGAIREAAAADVESLYLEVRDSNIAARALYASRGFAEVGRRRDYYRRPREDALVLRLTLPPAPTA
jgi:ribosomal-protein-alanine N-acetyltransferase